MEEITDFPRGQLNPSILSTMTNGDKYGYEIIDEIKLKTGIEIKQPSLYSSLKRMESQKLVSSYWKDSDIGGKRHYYCLTNDGRAFLQKNPIDLSLFKKIEMVEKIVEDIKPEVNNILEQPSNYEETTQIEKIKEDLSAGEIDKLPETVGEFSADSTYSSPFSQIEPQMPVEDIYVKNDIPNNDDTKLAQQENLFDLASSNQLSAKVEYTPENQPKSDQGLEQYDLFTEVDLAVDDGVLVTETLDDYDIPKFEKFEPASLNIETSKSADYLNAKLKNRELIKEDKQSKKQYQQKIASMFAKKQPEELERYDHIQSMENIQNKINRFEAQKAEKAYYEQQQQALHSTQQQTQAKLWAENEGKQASQSNIKGVDFNRVDNTYERIKQNTPIFNSYKSLQTYYNSKGIGFYPYVKKEKTSADFVNPALTRLLRGSLFFILSIIFAVAFYCGINATAIGKEIYIVIPCLALGLVCLYGFGYYKARRSSIIQSNKETLSPIILPIVSVCAILVIIGINLIIGFRAETTLYYFPLLIYPIILCAYIAIMIPLNKLINWLVLQVRKLSKKIR